MKVGVNTFIVREVSGNGFPLDELGVEVLELGFDDVEVLTENGINWDVLKNLAGLGVEFTLHAPTSDGGNVSVDLGHYSRMNVVTMERVFRVASALDASVVVIHGGDIRESYHRAFANTRRQLMEISAIAEDYGVELLMENLTDARVGAFPHELLPFIDENVGICLDVGHAFLTAMKYGVPMDEFALLKAEEAHVHDNNGERDEHLPPGEGMIGKNYIGRLVGAVRPDYVVLEIRCFSRPESVFESIEFAKSIGRVRIREVAR
ncbi:sugar phosphate isomerase/epimerase family protein [Thermococcus sp. 21S7]|uniref:sugar phosphate isomerase/epimerase family protein n=1 Tax=Thermococcus sp. 21S7 TaxID=1638221 RepID=UPI001439F501|nr:sugar phosphate isomerase/epimerase family protein [Thermococcus sp. 21S7]NJE60886.1 sugar phosphate isomerase/epimerase [Thermococcus sp. 21S7]